jgi:nucleotide-binding universal stress UspA family protein
MNILICTDGSSGSVQSAELVTKLGFPQETKITVLGVCETDSDIEKLTSSMDFIEKLIGKNYKLSKKIRNGNPIEEIMSEALESSYDIVAVGGGGSQLGLLQPKVGSTTRKLSRKLHTHFLVARNLPIKFSKILVCTGAETPSSMTMKLGGEWLCNTSAQIGLLHVRSTGKKGVEDLHADPGQQGLTSELIVQRDLQLTDATQQLRNAGLKNEIIPRIRQGLIVEEVIKELNEGAYELLVIGAHYQPGQDRWHGTLLDDVTDQLLHRCNCSVFII